MKAVCWWATEAYNSRCLGGRIWVDFERDATKSSATGLCTEGDKWWSYSSSGLGVVCGLTKMRRATTIDDNNNKSCLLAREILGRW